MIDYLEIRDESHLSDFEGSSYIKPRKNEIVKAVNERGYIPMNIEISYDSFQSMWRFNGDLYPIRIPTK